MNKILKFRAWDGRQMDYEVTAYGGRFIDCSGASEDVFYKWHDPSEEIAIMQFTGLYDNNNREIYEEDICIGYYPGAEQKYVNKILFHNGSFMFAGEPIGYWDDIEVIGNIYENPELLV